MTEAMDATNRTDTLGADAVRFELWTQAMRELLTAARDETTGPDSDDPAEAAAWYAERVALLHTDALPRIEALRDYGVDAHRKHKGSYGDLAVALGYDRDDRSEAQRLRNRAADPSRPHHYWPTDPARDEAAGTDAADRELVTAALHILLKRQPVGGANIRPAEVFTIVGRHNRAQAVVDLYARQDFSYHGRLDGDQAAIVDRAYHQALHILAPEQDEAA